MKVAKFGGSSLAGGDTFLAVKDIIESDNKRRYIVCSAPGKVHRSDTKITDLLYLLYDLETNNIGSSDIEQKIRDKYHAILAVTGVDWDFDAAFDAVMAGIKTSTKDYVASRGEYFNACILSRLIDYPMVDAKDVIFFDDNGNFDAAKSYKALEAMKKAHPKAVIPGFYGQQPDGTIATFSRGGGDLTGAVVARGVGAELYENWTDVSGFLSADPRIVKCPREVRRLTYKELRELSYAGANVIHAEAILPAQEARIPIQIKNTFMPEDEGTLILPHRDDAEEITGVSGEKGFAVINVEKLKLNSFKGFHRKLMSILEVNDINILHMPSSIDSISLIVKENNIAGKMDTVISELKTFVNPDGISVNYGIALITVVGQGMKEQVGCSAKVFTALAHAGINIRMIIQGASELNIIVGVDESNYDKAVAAIYHACVKRV
ncbi:aspartate kinase [Peptoniphilus equinus]|uniref:Aspartokinase n=1 Tax=Peptoniphilus equinus TaxID=3016343 RepID=A0ABY7QTM0_9FIRM|nr:aspartate kinase [Peptoniphilus equinus]WBW50135.1 aspartate kinase [Peptoniphilus equinus]